MDTHRHLEVSHMKYNQLKPLTVIMYKISCSGLCTWNKMSFIYLFNVFIGYEPTPHTAGHTKLGCSVCPFKILKKQNNAKCTYSVSTKGKMDHMIKYHIIVIKLSLWLYLCINSISIL